MDVTSADVVQVLTVAISIGGSILVAFWQRGKSRADSDKSVSDAWATYFNEIQEERERERQHAKNLEQRIDALAERVNVVEADNNRLLSGIKRLVGQLRRHGIEPEWTPDEGTTSNKPKRRRRM